MRVVLSLLLLLSSPAFGTFIGGGVTPNSCGGGLFANAINAAGILTCASAGSGDATTALDNLASVAINTALLPGVDGTIDLGSTSKRFRNLWVTGSLINGNYHLEPCETDSGNSGTTKTLDLSSCPAQKSTLTGNVTYTLSNPAVAGSAYIIRILTGAGGFTATWPASVKWSGGTAPTITATAARMDLINLLYDGTNYYGTFTQNFTP